jgi:hypothetical protein
MVSLYACVLLNTPRGKAGSQRSQIPASGSLVHKLSIHLRTLFEFLVKERLRYVWARVCVCVCVCV